MRLPKYQNKAAFTLIECLISLAILSAVLLSISLLIRQTTKVEQYLQRKDQKEWLIFLAQFEEEIKKGKNVVIKDNRIYYELEKKTYLFEQYHALIRKREVSGTPTCVNTSQALGSERFYCSYHIFNRIYKRREV